MTVGRPVQFKRPPVVETVLSVSFSPVEGLLPPQVGRFWVNELESDFPVVREVGPYDMPFERTGDPSWIPSVGLSIGPAPSKTRIWFVSDDDERVVQVQRDFFAYNWRKRIDAYVGYPEGRELFRQYFTRFDEFVVGEKLGSVSPVQCEVVYVNHIERSKDRPLSRVLRILNEPDVQTPANQVESWQVALALSLDRGGEQFGRLHVSAQPAIVDGGDYWVMNLLARGRPEDSSIDGVLEFFDDAHQAIVLNFAEMTTEEMHTEWSRQ